MLKLALIPNTDCKRNCRYRIDRSVTTAMFYTPIYDKLGNNVNHDQNTTMSTITCTTCEKTWLVTIKGSDITYTEKEDLNGYVR